MSFLMFMVGALSALILTHWAWGRYHQAEMRRLSCQMCDLLDQSARSHSDTLGVMTGEAWRLWEENKRLRSLNRKV